MATNNISDLVLFFFTIKLKSISNLPLDTGAKIRVSLHQSTTSKEATGI